MCVATCRTTYREELWLDGELEAYGREEEIALVAEYLRAETASQRAALLEVIRVTRIEKVPRYAHGTSQGTLRIVK